MKERLDVLLVKRNLAVSREKAKAVIMAGEVYVDGQKEDKAGSMFQDSVHIEVRGNTLPYVSRGGLKLEKAMTHFGVSLEGKVCLDVGASTGGLQTVCFRMGQRGSMPSMWGTDSWIGSCEMTQEWSAWRRRTFGMSYRMTSGNRRTFPPLMCLLSL